jgi:hypothetical protein
MYFKQGFFFTLDLSKEAQSLLSAIIWHFKNNPTFNNSIK